jgi:transposase
VEQHSEVFVGVDAAKLRHAVAVAEDGRQGEVRYLGEIGTDPESVRRLAARLEKRHGGGLHFCPENRGQAAVGSGYAARGLSITS